MRKIKVLLLSLALACVNRLNAQQLVAKPQAGTVPLIVQFTLTAPGAVAFNWQFGDGGIATSSPTQTHTYTSVGDFDALVVWVDKVGAGGHADIIVNITAPAITSNTNPNCLPGDVVSYPDGPVDGFATKPKVCMYTAMSATPTTNPPKVVKATDSLPALQAVFTAAKCGDLIQLEPGNWVGAIKWPSCPTGGWIVVEPTTIAEFPNEETRVSPAYAGVASLPGRPPYIQPAGGAKKLMPTIVLVGSQTASGCNHTRVIGFEIARGPGTGTTYNLVAPGAGAVDCVFDRDWIHGTAMDETVRGFALSGASRISIINSYMSDFHCLAVIGACGDAQAIWGGASMVPGERDGFKFVNNFLESSGENVLFGGSAGMDQQCDAMIMYNDFFKPWFWDPADPSYAPVRGRPWIVKNHLELKTGCRFLVEGNRMQNVWGGFSQVGASILLTPKNPGGPALPVTSACPVCAVMDITIRYNYSSYMDQSTQIGYGPSDPGGWGAQSGNWSIHDNVFDHIQYGVRCYGCGSVSQQLGSGRSPAGLVLLNVKGNHNTFANDGWQQNKPQYQWPAQISLGMSGPPSDPKMANIVWDDNIQATGASGLYSLGGGATNCATVAGIQPIAKVTQCWAGASEMRGNVWMMAGYSGGKNWPAGNFFSTSWAGVGFVDEVAGNYKLSPTSPYLKKATDGKDPGADVALVNAALAKRN
jgi:hypothetical protein